MEAATTMCLVLASHRGSVSLVSGSSPSQNIGPSYTLPVVPGGQKTAGARTRGSSWLCDAAVMHDARAIVYALSDRSLHFYDTACSLRSDAVQEHRHLWRVVNKTFFILNKLNKLFIFFNLSQMGVLFTHIFSIRRENVLIIN
jgi:hypothetical protein